MLRGYLSPMPEKSTIPKLPRHITRRAIEAQSDLKPASDGDEVALKRSSNEMSSPMETLDVATGLFSAAEQLSDAQIDQMVATNLVGSIQIIRAVLHPILAPRARTYHPDIFVRWAGRFPRKFDVLRPLKWRGEGC